MNTHSSKDALHIAVRLCGAHATQSPTLRGQTSPIRRRLLQLHIARKDCADARTLAVAYGAVLVRCGCSVQYTTVHTNCRFPDAIVETVAQDDMAMEWSKQPLARREPSGLAITQTMSRCMCTKIHRRHALNNKKNLAQQHPPVRLCARKLRPNKIRKPCQIIKSGTEKIRKITRAAAVAAELDWVCSAGCRGWSLCSGCLRYMVGARVWSTVAFACALRHCHPVRSTPVIMARDGRMLLGGYIWLGKAGRRMGNSR